MAGTSRTLDEHQLAAELMKARQDAGITLHEAAAAVGISHISMYRMETGKVRLHTQRVRDRVRTLLTVYGWNAADSERFVGRIERSRQADWWSQHRDAMTPQEREQIGRESSATIIRYYASSHVPMLLRTPEYARALLELDHPHRSAAWIERSLALQLQHQERFFGNGGPDPDTRRQMWALIEEPVLLAEVGSPQVRQQQHDHLLELADSRRREVHVQILPATAPPTPARSLGPFSILRYAPAEVPDHVVCGATGWHVLTDPRETEPFIHALNATAAIHRSAQRAGRSAG